MQGQDEAHHLPGLSSRSQGYLRSIYNLEIPIQYSEGSFDKHFLGNMHYTELYLSPGCTDRGGVKTSESKYDMQPTYNRRGCQSELSFTFIASIVASLRDYGMCLLFLCIRVVNKVIKKIQASLRSKRTASDEVKMCFCRLNEAQKNQRRSD